MFYTITSILFLWNFSFILTPILFSLTLLSDTYEPALACECTLDHPDTVLHFLLSNYIVYKA